jgi:hypothetical protein
MLKQSRKAYGILAHPDGKVFAIHGGRGQTMTTFHIRTAALLVAAVALTAAPSFAQRTDRQDGGRAERRDGGRVERRDGGERAQARRGDGERRAEQYRPDANRRYDNRANDNRRYDNRAYDNRRRDNRAYDNRRYDNRSYNYRPYNYRPYNYRSYGYRSYGRSYVVPYGYRPYGYRPGWSLNLYFGRPYGYGYGYPAAGYGYYPLSPGRPYGSLRIVDAPPDAQVLVDGYYAGVVDDYDGVFQHLNLEAGSHHIEIEDQGYSVSAFDVYIEPGRTVTYHAR